MKHPQRRVAVLTCTCAEFGLLETVIRAIAAHDDLELLTVVTGSHLLEPACTWREVAQRWPIAATIPMQQPGETTRLGDAAALGRGIEECAQAFNELKPDWVVVLGDRIEAFAGAAAASVGGIALAHLHGGDRAEGIADEAMRHAITKLAHLHLPASEQSAQRIIQMGEEPSRVHVVGSPALDGLANIEPIGDDRWIELGEPDVVFMLHPIGRADSVEHSDTIALIDALEGRSIAAMHPNYDPGRNGIVDALTESLRAGNLASLTEHLPRHEFVGLLKRLAVRNGTLIGNSSAGLIESAALRLPVVDIGPRQAGRERPANVVHIDDYQRETIRPALDRVIHTDLSSLDNPYGAGDAGVRVADLLAKIDPSQQSITRKQCVY
jgi:UDP-hydrolysing UDP-N-acetyl-D-glucosamine 2-epimerase